METPGRESIIREGREVMKSRFSVTRLAAGLLAAVSLFMLVGDRGLTAPPARVITSSGRPLYPDFAWDGTAARDVRLGGEARIVSTGEIRPDALIDD